MDIETEIYFVITESKVLKKVLLGTGTEFQVLVQM